MSRSADLVALLRGLDKVRQALVVTQQGEMSRAWQNSSVRAAVQGVGLKAEERISDAVLKVRWDLCGRGLKLCRQK